MFFMFSFNIDHVDTLFSIYRRDYVPAVHSLFLILLFVMLYSGPPRFDGERRFGDREGYRGGPRGPGGDFGDKGGAPADYRPSFGVIYQSPASHTVITFK